jgi:CRP-like cAMP-binding protein
MANNNASNPPSPGTAEQAINQVLQAERETSQAVTDCEQEAHAIRQASRQHARRIHQRTDNRISLMQMSVTQRVTGDIQSMDREEENARLEQSVRPLDETGLAECIEEVARILSGGEPSPVGTGNPDE